MRSVGLVYVLICGRGPGHSLDHLPIPPLLHASTTARPWPFAHVFRGTNKAHSILSCYVSLPTNVSATVGQWLILVHLAKCLQDVCLGCLFPPPCPPLLPHVFWSRGSRVACPDLLLLLLPHPPSHGLSLPLFSAVGVAHHHRGDTKHYLTWQLSSFWPQLLFDPPCCLLSACCWCMMGEGLTQHGGVATLHCQRGWLAYHSILQEEIHHYGRQGFPSSASPFTLHLIM